MAKLDALQHFSASRILSIHETIEAANSDICGVAAGTQGPSVDRLLIGDTAASAPGLPDQYALAPTSQRLCRSTTTATTSVSDLVAQSLAPRHTPPEGSHLPPESQRGGVRGRPPPDHWSPAALPPDQYACVPTSQRLCRSTTTATTNVSDLVAQSLAPRHTPPEGSHLPPEGPHSSSARALRAASSSASRAATLAACWVRASSISSSIGAERSSCNSFAARETAAAATARFRAR